MGYFVITISSEGDVYVEVFSKKHRSVSGFTSYFAVSPATVARLRRVFVANRKHVYVRRGWSPAVRRAYKLWYLSAFVPERNWSLEASLDLLPTKVQPCPK